MDTVITVGAAVNPGGIGGPVITMDEKLAGIIVDKEVSLFAEGLAYMVNIDLIHTALNSNNPNSEPLGAIKEYETLDKLGMAFEKELESYDANRVKEKIALLKDAKKLVEEAMSNSSSNIVPAFFLTYFNKLYFRALAEDYEETIAMKVYEDYVFNALEIRTILYEEKYPDGNIPEEEQIYLTIDSFDSMSLAADRARMRIVEYGLEDIKSDIRKSDFYGYLFFGTPPTLFKSILQD
jgi:hypothetical protein